MWYEGTSNLVGFYWDWLFDDCVIVDGSSDQIGSRQAWHAFISHPKVGPTLRPFAFGSTAGHAQHILVVDRKRRRFFVMQQDEGEAMLRTAAPVRTKALTLAKQRPVELRSVSRQAGTRMLDHQLISKDLANELIHTSTGMAQAMVAWLDTDIASKD